LDFVIFCGGSRGLLAAPNGAARKELGGKIKRRGEMRIRFCQNYFFEKKIWQNLG